MTSVEGSAIPSDGATGVADVTLPLGAVVSVSSSGQYTYDPISQFDSVDESDEATVTILIPGGSDGPVDRYGCGGCNAAIRSSRERDDYSVEQMCKGGVVEIQSEHVKLALCSVYFILEISSNIIA